MSKYLLPFIFLLLLMGCTRKLIPETVTVIRDTVITVPSDTVFTTISIKELCDTLYKRDTVIIHKKGRVKNIVTVKRDSITFICEADSLRKVIEVLRQSQTVVTEKPNQWKPMHILILLFLIAVLLGAVTNLFKK